MSTTTATLVIGTDAAGQPVTLPPDLFSGTGTTRLVAEGLGRRGVSVEMVEDAINLNAARDHLPLDSALSQMTGSTT